MQIFLLRPFSALKLREGNITGTRFKVQAGCRRNREFVNCIGNSLLCYGGNCCVQLWDLLWWVLQLGAHGIRAKD